MSRTLFVMTWGIILLTLLGARPAYTQELEILRVPLEAKFLIYHEGLERLIAATPPTDSALPNAVALINPLNGAIEQSVYVGSNINVLSLSDEGSKLYAGLLGANLVVKVDVASMTVDTSFALGENSNGPSFAEDIAVQPGNPDVIAVSLQRKGLIPKHDGVAIYDKGVRRPMLTPSHTGSNVLAFGDNPDILYGLNTETTEYGFRRMEVTSLGVNTLSNTLDILWGYPNNIKYQDGLIYGVRGQIVEPEDGVLLGRFPVLDVRGTLLDIAPDTNTGRSFVLKQIDQNRLSIEAYDNATFSRIATQHMTGIEVEPPYQEAAQLVRWGDRGLAFKDLQGQVVILTSALLDPSISFLDVNPATILFGDVSTPQSELITITNTGTAPLVVDSVGTSHPEIEFSLSNFSLAPGDSIEGIVAFNPSQYGLIFGELQFVSNSIGSPTVLPVIVKAEIKSLTIHPSVLDFGEVGVSTGKELTIEIENAGIEDINISSIQSNSLSFAVSDSMVTLKPDTPLTLPITFQPTEVGLSEGYITIESNVFAASDSFIVTGLGVLQPTASLNTREIILKDVPIGLERDTLFQVTNNGQVTLNVHSLQSDNDALVVAPTPFELAPGASRDISITFIASQIGTQQGTITFESNSPTSPDSVHVSAEVAANVSNESLDTPALFSLGQNYPNPVTTASTKVPFSLSDPSPASLHIFDVLGRHLLTIEKPVLTAGSHSFSVDAAQLPNGVYLYQLEANGQKKNKLLTIMR